MKEGCLKILKPVALEIIIFGEKKNQNFKWKTTLRFGERTQIFSKVNPPLKSERSTVN